MAMNLRKHFKERYVERILGIKDPNEIRQYIGQNEAQIVEHINKLFEFSRLLYKGQIGGDKSTKHFYLNSDIIMVADGTNTCLITLYKCDFGFPEHLNKANIKGLVTEIEKLQELYKEESLNEEDEIERKKVEIENINVDIQSLENQIKYLKSKKDILESEIKIARHESVKISKTIEKYCTMLCNSLEFRREVMNENVN